MLLGQGGPGSANVTSSKSKAMADLNDSVTKLNQNLEKTNTISGKIRGTWQSIGQSMGYRPNNTVMAGEHDRPGTSMDLNPTRSSGTYNGGQASGNYSDGGSGLGRTAAVYGATRAYEAMKTSEYYYNDIVTRRFGFFAGLPGRQLGSENARALNERGYAISGTDALEAQLLGTERGLMPGMQRTTGVLNSVTDISNLTGAGLQAGMGATASLQQGQVVNRLRMIGVRVRNDKGLPRAIEDIAKDLWGLLNQSKRGSAPLTKKDLDLSLLPGNSLDMLLNQYFSSDPVLRQAIVAALYQMASGGDFSKAGLEATGAMAGSAKATAERNASIYQNRDRSTDAGVAGVTGANVVARAGNEVVNFIRSIPVIGNIADLVQGALTFGQTLGGLGGERESLPTTSSMFGYGQGSGLGIGDGDVSVAKSMSSPLENDLIVNSEFNSIRTVKGKKTSPHKGIDFRAGTGATIRAVKGGKVTAKAKNAALGNYVSITHPDGFVTTYAHMKSPSTATGTVDAGDPIGFVGQTGFADGPHLHLAVQDSNGKYYNPRDYLEGRIGSTKVKTASDNGSEQDSENEFRNSIGLFKGTKNKTSLFKGVGGGDVPLSNMSSSVSYGGVTVNINLPKGSAMDERQLAREIKRVLNDEEQLKRTVGR